ncbi:SMEK domain-containing protein [Bacillus sp. UMB0728]|uniref:SMEK domain-containing protein n=1 Tax=Bacillus sp. UMB0728 TaxID=2066052 RepID=UPI000C761F87|nr:SMEK domain-containing protein [Bacillus sp. UMB0728]PLR70535.1 hypothetical protein CYJ37_23670 [Bacillus sp. UMB0728]
MLKRYEDLHDIIKGLSLLNYYVKFSSNKLGQHTINKVSETFFCEMLNIIYEKQLKRLEGKKKNNPGIDLADIHNKFAVQVTSDGSKVKYKKTIEQFEKGKQFAKYRTLLHFIIGEKHFTPPKQFRKLPSSYHANIQTVSHEYEVIIQDIFDLAVLIDDLESDILAELHEYILKNIYKTIEQFKQKVYDIEIEQMVSFTAKAYIKSLGLANASEEKELFNDLDILARIVNKLDDNSRRVIYCILDEYKPTPSYDIFVPSVAVQKRLKINDTQTFSNELIVLLHENLLDEESLRDENLLNLRFLDTVGKVNLFGEIHKYCTDKKLSIKDLILKPDFSLLD